MHCSAYWQCFAGASLVKCCSSGQLFKTGSGCVADTNNECNTVCSPESQFEPLIEVTELGCTLTNQDCPDGTVYNVTTCSCTHTTGKFCVPTLNLTFSDQQVKDHSQNRFYITQKDITVSNGIVNFVHTDSTVSVPGTANMPMGSDFFISVTFKLRDRAPSLQAVLGNKPCLGLQEPSILITVKDDVNTDLINVNLLLKTSTFVSQDNVTFSVQRNQWLEAAMRYDGKMVVASLFNNNTVLHSASWSAQGDIQVRRAALVLGNGYCDDYDNFDGSYDEFLLYRCGN
ncbi:hypothetical protein SNE40_016556 [Patella caerulea]|uniref:Chitin-binding type-2 domain-containing protein n=1 Tax=Patella caerulea TaxID=87958 RepID=A0AAN8JBR2_PATCE